MTRLIYSLCLCVSVVLLLSACASTDPYVQIASGEAALQATAIARNVAAQETRGALSAAVIEGTRYAGEVLAVEAQLRGTEEAIAYQQTEIALQDTRAASEFQATQAAATSSAIRIQSTQNFIVQYGAAMSTATAIVVQQQIYATSAVRAENRSNAIRWTGVVLLFGLVVCFLLALAMIIDVLHRRGIAQADLLHARGDWLTQRAATPQLPAGPASTAGDPDPKDEVIQLLFASANIVGKNSARIPRHSDLPGFDPNRWTLATNSLVQSGAVIKVERSGTYIRQPWKTINGLYEAITTGRLHLQPPHPTAPSAWNAPRTDTEQITEQIQEYA